MFTTYRLTEHHTAGGMSRWTPYLAELQPEMFCEVSPELAAERGLEHTGWATIVTARTAIEARVLVTERAAAAGRRAGGAPDRAALPLGPNGLTTGDAANELRRRHARPQRAHPGDKVGTCDIRPGRRPRGHALVEYLVEYRRRAGLEERRP